MPNPAYSPHALTTVAQCEAELNLSSSTSTDALITRLINVASDRIAKYCNRTLEYGSAIVDNVAGYGDTHLVVSRPPLVSLTGITFNGSTVDPTFYSVDNADAGTIYRNNGWIWTASRNVSITWDPQPNSEQQFYAITYAGGWVTQPQIDLGTYVLPRTLPYDIEDACIQFVTMRYMDIGENKRVSAERLMSASQSYWDKDLPPDIKAILDQYRLEPVK